MSHRAACWIPILLAAIGCIDRSPPSRPESHPPLFNLDGQALHPFEQPGVKAVALIFVLPDCPIANSYFPAINRLQAEFAPQGVELIVVQADPATTAEQARGHAKEYRIEPPVVLDADHAWVTRAQGHADAGGRRHFARGRNPLSRPDRRPVCWIGSEAAARDHARPARRPRSNRPRSERGGAANRSRRLLYPWIAERKVTHAMPFAAGSFTGLTFSDGGTRRRRDRDVQQAHRAAGVPALRGLPPSRRGRAVFAIELCRRQQAGPADSGSRQAPLHAALEERRRARPLCRRAAAERGADRAAG